jgi:hypothetical protein
VGERMKCGFGELNSNHRIDDLTLAVWQGRWCCGRCYVHANSVYSALSRKTTVTECAKKTPQNAICSGLMWIMERSASTHMGLQLDLCIPSPKNEELPSLLFGMLYRVCLAQPSLRLTTGLWHHGGSPVDEDRLETRRRRRSPV